MQWFNDLKLAVKLTCSFALLAVLTAFVGVRGREAVVDVGGRIDFMNRNVTTSLAALQQIQREICMQRGNMWLLLPVRDERVRASVKRDFERGKQRTPGLMKAYEATVVFPGEAEAFAALKHNYAQLIGDYERMVALSDDHPEQVVAVASQLRDLYLQTMANVDTLIEINQREGAARTRSAVDFASATSRQLLVTTLAAALLAVVLGSLIARSIAAAVNQVKHAASRIAEGDLEVRVELEQKDELGELASAQRRMTERLRATVLEIQAVAEQVAAGSEQVTSSSRQLSDGAARQSSAAEEASASVEQMTGSIGQNAESAAQTERIATQTAEDAERSGIAVTNSVNAMHEIAGKISIVEEIARKRLCRRRRRSSALGRAQPARRWRNHGDFGVQRARRPVGGRDAQIDRARHPPDLGARARNLGRHAGAARWFPTDQRRDPGARSSDSAERGRGRATHRNVGGVLESRPKAQRARRVFQGPRRSWRALVAAFAATDPAKIELEARRARTRHAAPRGGRRMMAAACAP